MQDNNHHHFTQLGDVPTSKNQIASTALTSLVSTMKRFLPLVALALAPFAAHCSDLFTDRKPIEFKKFTPLAPETTIGGYAMYRGGHTWLLLDLKTANSGSDADTDDIAFGSATLIATTDNRNWLATMVVAVSLSSASTAQWFTGNPCAGPHTATINKSSGVWDNCLTLDVREGQSKGKNATFLELLSTQSKSGGRSYRLYLALNLDELGFPSTSVSDWSDTAIGSNPRKKAFLQRTIRWAELLQTATTNALAFNKPQDVFKEIPPIYSLSDSQSSEALSQPALN